jgi:hypothetical protein
VSDESLGFDDAMLPDVMSGSPGRLDAGVEVGVVVATSLADAGGELVVDVDVDEATVVVLTPPLPSSSSSSSSSSSLVDTLSLREYKVKCGQFCPCLTLSLIHLLIRGLVLTWWKDAVSILPTHACSNRRRANGSD